MVQQLTRERQELLGRFGENHPDVKQVERRIQSIRDAARMNPGGGGFGGGPGVAGTRPPGADGDRRVEMLEKQLEMLRTELREMRREMQRKPD
jgi:chaperonin cofactor prefoldin